MKRMKMRLLAALALLALTTQSAFAALDVAASVTALTGATVTNVELVGAALITLSVAAVAIKWVKGTIMS